MNEQEKINEIIEKCKKEIESTLSSGEIKYGLDIGGIFVNLFIQDTINENLLLFYNRISSEKIIKDYLTNNAYFDSISAFRYLYCDKNVFSKDGKEILDYLMNKFLDKPSCKDSYFSNDIDLTPLNANDAIIFYEDLCNYKNFKAYASQITKNYKYEASKSVVKSYSVKTCFAIRNKHKEFLGMIGIQDNELSYYILEKYRHNGYGNEALKLVISSCKKDKPLTAIVNGNNKASIALLEKNGVKCKNVDSFKKNGRNVYILK